MPDTKWSRAELRVLARLTSPARIQAFLDQIPYSTDPIYRSPRSVLRDRRAHCLDGALLAAAALRRLGYPPLLVDLRAVRDDDHVLAIYRAGTGLGAIAKSNFVGLRFREPIHRTLRELALGYFEDYYNAAGEKTLRAYSQPLDLRRLDRLGWMTRDDDLAEIATRLDRVRHHPLLSAARVARLSPVDPRSYQAGMLGTDPAGLYHG